MQHALAQTLARHVRVFRGMATSEVEREAADKFMAAIARTDKELQPVDRRAANFARREQKPEDKK